VNRLAEILREKGSEVYTVEASASVYDAIERMVQKNVGALLVTDAAGEVSGIVTERDYLRHVELEGRTARETKVEAIMSSPLVYVTPETTVDESMALMTERRIRHLPVFDEKVVGLVSIGDVVKFQSKQQSVQIQHLTDYITAR
jgi:CBS domain-containing protein